MAFLKLTPKDCSPLGQFILKYMEDNQLTMSELADRAGITRPGLRAMCLKRANPTASSVVRLAHATGKPVTELYQLVRENKTINPYEPDAIDFLLKGVEILFKELQESAKKMPEQERPSDFELLDKALKTVRALQK